MVELGVAREMARMVLPVNLYTEFYWTVNARSLMNFVALRADGHAQWEIQQYGEAMARAFRETMPWTYEAFLRHAWKGENAMIAGEVAALPSPEPAAK
jgi:thymidylate synthase (FAD)